ncbi:MAG: thioredoxin family protein [Planctomycetota bacterium]
MKWMQSLHRMILAAVLVAVVAPVVAQDGIPWITDLRQARETAERQHRLVLLHFWGENCAPCKQVERNVFNQPEFIRALTTGYIPVKINATQQPQLAEFYNIKQVPTDVIVTPEGKEVHRFSSLQDSNQYIAVLDGIRAQASVGAYGPTSPSQTPVASRPQQDSASAAPYGGYAPGQAGQSRYGQGGYGQSPLTQPPADSAQSYPQNRFTNPLDQQAAPQQQELAPRYGNPYGQQAPENSNTSGSRYGQPTQGDGPNDGNQARPSTAPQANEFVRPGAAPSQVAQGRPIQNPTYGGTATQPSQYGGGQLEPQITIPQNPAPPANPPQSSGGQPQISLEGYCPVTLVHNRVWTPGDKKWGAVHEGRVYLFAGPQQQQQFLANPHVYAPLMAGYDPVRFAETGQLVPGRREFGLYTDEPGPIALFADEAALERFHANSTYYFNVIRQAKTQQAGGATR